MQPYWQYKVYKNGTFLAFLADVKSDFNTAQLLNTPGCQLQVELSRTPDQPIPDFGDDSLICEGNTLIVTLFNDTYPNGKLKFNGYISTFVANYGGPETIQFTALSYGQQLDNVGIESGDTVYLSNPEADGVNFNSGVGGSKDTQHLVIQTFSVSADTLIGSLDLLVSTPDAASMFVNIRQQAGGSPNPNVDPIIMSGSLALDASLSQVIAHVVFLAASTLTTGNTYYMDVLYSGNNYLLLWGDDANPYAGGTVWTTALTSGTSWDSPTQISGTDLYFILYEHGGSTIADYEDVDPSFMVGDIMNYYDATGGIIKPPPNPVTPIYSLPLSDGNIAGAFWGTAFAQTFTPTANITINIIQLMLGTTSGSENVTIQLCRGNPSLDSIAVSGGHESYTFGGSNTVLQTSNTRSITSTNANVTGFQITPQALVSGTEYYVLIQFGQGQFGNLVLKGGTSSDSIPSPFGDMYQGLVTSNNSGVSMTFNSSSPAMFCAVGFISPVPANLDGGYANTGITTDYTFKVNTILEGIQKALSLSPQDWYWYVDIATNILVFQQTGTTADHIMILGKHINELNLARTSEGIKNIVYFSGGDDGSGVNVFVKKTNATSLGSGIVGLDRISDSNVTDTTVGGLLAQDDLDRNSLPVWQTTLSVPAGVYDIDSFNLGQIIGFGNFGNWIDALLLQIVAIQYNPDIVTLTLGSQIPRSTQDVQAVQRQLLQLQTIANPASPS